MSRTGTDRGPSYLGRRLRNNRSSRTRTVHWEDLLSQWPSFGFELTPASSWVGISQLSFLSREAGWSIARYDLQTD